MDVLITLKEQGKVRHIGVSNFTRKQIQEAEQFGSVEACQPQYSRSSEALRPKWSGTYSRARVS